MARRMRHGGRTGSWHNRFRGVRIRGERKAETDLALVHLAGALIALKQAR